MRPFHLGLAAALLAFPALADDPLGTPVAADALGNVRVSDNVLQGNTTDQASSNLGSIRVGGTKQSGTISPATVIGNHGITTVMQNTGDMVNVSNATNVNVYLH